MAKNKIGIIGAGAYGTALNKLLGLNSNNSVLISDVVNKDISNFSTFDKVLSCEYLVFAIPSKFVLSFLEENSKFFTKNQKVLIGTKGFCENGELLSSAFSKYFEKNNICYLAGPGFASEIMENPSITRLSVSGFNINVSEEYSKLFSKNICTFSSGVLSYEITSALKNVAAFVCGISFGTFKSLNFKYSVASKIYCEISTIVERFEGNPITCLTNPLLQADLYMTTSQEESRNFKFGELVCEIGSVKKSLGKIDYTVEGLNTIESLIKMKNIKSGLLNELVILPTICDLVEHKIKLNEFINILESLDFNCCNLKE
jgi:glycerol-3-phosphate dehydrogenase (NAD(P)+)